MTGPRRHTRRHDADLLIPSENTNFLQTRTGTRHRFSGNPFTYDYEFNQSKRSSRRSLAFRSTVPPFRRRRDIRDRPEHPSLLPIGRPNSDDTGYTGYLTGGWTGIGSGYPSAFGYMNPTDQGSVYIAPNMTFDFTEIQYKARPWRRPRLTGRRSSSSHRQCCRHADRRVADPRLRRRGVEHHDQFGATGSPYTTQMYTDFIAQAYCATTTSS